MTLSDIEAIEKRAAAATAGPWGIGGRIAGLREDHVAVFGGRDFGCAVMNGNHETDVANAAHIAGMDPSTTLSLCAEVRRLKALVGEK